MNHLPDHPGGESPFVRKVTLPVPASIGRADYQVAIIDGQPEMVLNAAAIARLACDSPLGIHAAMANLKQAMSTEDFAKIEAKLQVIANG